MDSVISDQSWINQNTFVDGLAYTGNMFSRTDSAHLYGIGYKGAVPETFEAGSLRINISAYVRIIGQDGRASLVISVQKGDSSVYWENRQILPRVPEQATWTEIKDEISIPANLTGKGYTLLIYFWNETANLICDIDDLKIRFSELHFPSFLIDSDTLSFDNSTGDFIEVYSGTYFRMEYDKYDSQIRILSPNKKILLHSFSIFCSWSDSEKKQAEVKEISNRTFFLRGESNSEEGRIFTLESRSEIFENKITLLFSNTEPLILFSLSSNFLQNVSLNRMSLSASFSPELLEVYRSSGLKDSATFQEEYWLGKGGFQAYSDNAGFIIYHEKNISSMQLSSSRRRITVNLDWELDHPLLHFPLLKESANKSENHSSRFVKKGSTLTNSFSLQGIRSPRPVPRISKYPSGKSAGLIWTEHADYSDLQLQRAVNFGSDSIQNSADAIGGFVKHGIPVTKSVFYSNPDKVMNSVKAGFIKSEIATLHGAPGFKEFLLDLQANDHEICLHTPDHFTSGRSLLEEALSSTSEDFKSISWIDHGYDNGIKSNREDLVCDALDPNSKYFSADLWKEYGLKYFWNCFYEDTNLFSGLSFNSFMTVPYYGWGDRFPLPEYWRHESRSGEIIHWRTTGTLDPPDGSMWNYFMSENRLEDLIQSRATSIIHSYPARADSTNGFYESKKNGFVIQRSFDEALERQANLRDAGRLHISTVREHLDYNIALENIQITFLTNGKIRIENKNLFDLKGFSLILPDFVRVGVRGKSMHSRNEGDEIFLWFDLNKGETVILDIL